MLRICLYQTDFFETLYPEVFRVADYESEVSIFPENKFQNNEIIFLFLVHHTDFTILAFK